MNYETQEEYEHFEGAMEQSVPSQEEQGSVGFIHSCHLFPTEKGCIVEI